jgi:hypothetical protein
VPQLFTSLCVSVHAPEHRVDADDGQPLTHEYVPPDPAQTGVLPPQALPHVPQFCAVVSCTQDPLQAV